MSESAVKKPVLNITTTTDIQSSGHGVLRFRKWMAGDSAAIRKLSCEELGPRAFAERLLALQSIEPKLTAEEIKDWDDTELTAVARAWWEEVDRLNSAPLPADSLEAFQQAIRQRIAEQTERMREIPRDLGFAISRIPELNMAEKMARAIARSNPRVDLAGINSAASLAREMARSNSLLDLAHPHSALQALRQAELAAPLAFARRLQEEQRSFSIAQEKWRELETLTQSRLAASEMTRRFAGIEHLAGFAGIHSSAMAHAAEIEKMTRQIRDQLRGYESSLDSLRIKDALSALDTSAYKRFAPALVEIQSLAAALKGPWVNKLHPELSAAGLTHIAALTAAAHAPTPFSVPTVATIREALGDWRDLRMPWRLLPDATLRERFYLDHGFDSNLIQLPEPAFSQALVRTGLVRPPASVPAEETPADEETVLEQRMNRAYALFLRFERKLREFIDAQMSAKCGTGWERHRCPGNGKIYQGWVAKRDAEVSNGLSPQKLIDYIDFREYADLITKADNWREVFKDVFQREENVREAFARLGPVRVCTMHARAITKTEFMLAASEITRLLIAIGVSVDEEDTE